MVMLPLPPPWVVFTAGDDWLFATKAPPAPVVIVMLPPAVRSCAPW
jgi:hypothetical protein